MLKRTATLSLLALMQAACATTLSAGDPVDLSGRLALRGNEPFIYPVVYDAHGVWELEGLSREQALSLQNQQVKVHGTITRAADAKSVQLPAVQVQSLEPVQPAGASPK
jgi:hypothetical protein